MSDYPKMMTPVDHMEPVPRRVRAVLGGKVVLDTTRAVYLWEWAYYPQYYIPVDDIDSSVLVDEDHVEKLRRGAARRFGLRVGAVSRPKAGRVFAEEPLTGLVRLDWDAVDAWYEEVFVHPRNPYTRVDALRSTRVVRVEWEGAVLAESGSPVMVFETGLPTRYYLNRTDVDFTKLEWSPTVTACPYKGKTTDYWSVRDGGTLHKDLAWSYSFPTAALSPIAGLVSFYNEKLDIVLDGQRLERPVTHFS